MPASLLRKVGEPGSPTFTTLRPNCAPKRGAVIEACGSAGAAVARGWLERRRIGVRVGCFGTVAVGGWWPGLAVVMWGVCRGWFEDRSDLGWGPVVGMSGGGSPLEVGRGGVGERRPGGWGAVVVWAGWGGGVRVLG